VKVKLLQRLKDMLEIIFCIHAGDIERGRMRGDFGLGLRRGVAQDVRRSQ